MRQGSVSGHRWMTSGRHWLAQHRREPCKVPLLPQRLVTTGLFKLRSLTGAEKETQVERNKGPLLTHAPELPELLRVLR